MKPIKIGVDYFKMAYLLLVAVGFIAIGVFFFNSWIPTDSTFDIFFQFVGAISMLFFGLVLVSMVKRMITGRLGLTINDEGIIDYTNGTSVGLIKWEDIKKIDSFSYVGQSFIRVFVKNPEAYANKSGNIFERFFRRQNERFFKSGIQISANTLAIPHSDLFYLIKEEFKKRES